MKTLDQNILKFISRHSLFIPNDRILLAFSGGPDSLFLLHFLLKFQAKLKIEIFSCHINHQLREKESDQDETFCVKLCNEKKVKIFTEKVNVIDYSEKEKISIEEAARVLRYKSLEKIRSQNNCTKIVTAHNCDDNAETILLNLLKGTGLSGISGIPIKRDFIVRPLLNTNKFYILDYLEKNKLQFRIDKTNLDSKFQRNFLRNEILPKLKEHINPNLNDALFRSSLNFKNAKEVISSAVEEAGKKYTKYEGKKLYLSTDLFTGQNNFIAGEVIKSLLYKFFSIKMEFDDFLNLLDLSKNQTGKKTELSNNIISIKNRNEIIIFMDSDKEETEIEIGIDEKVSLGEIQFGISKQMKNVLPVNINSKTEYISADNIHGKFCLRNWRNGDSFTPLGMNGSKNISDFLTDEKVPANKKKSQLILLNRNNIVWVVGLRIDDRYKITSKTKKVCKLWVN